MQASQDMLLLNQVKSPIGRVPLITQTFERIRLCFRMKVRFSESFLAQKSSIHVVLRLGPRLGAGPSNNYCLMSVQLGIRGGGIV